MEGKIAWNTSSSTGGGAFIAGVLLMMGDDKGEAYLRGLSKQKVIDVGVTARAMIDKVAEGEYPLALSIFNHHAVMAAQAGAPVAWLPMEPVVASLAMTGIVKNAPHPNAARLFVDFLLSKPTQELFANLGFLPAMPSVPAKTPTLKPEQGGFKAVYLTPDIVAADAQKWQSLYNKYFR
jgi:ABC-type Fe3+ transport system substrate-binding protein